MKRLFKQIRPLVLLLFAGAFLYLSCDDSECSETGLPMVRMAFWDKETNANVALTDTLTITAAGTDSTLYNRGVNTSYVKLNMNYTKNVTTYYLRLGYYDRTTEQPAEIRDTIEIRHTNREFFLSMECGVAVFHDIDTVLYTRNMIDSLVVKDPSVNKDEKDNIHIYPR